MRAWLILLFAAACSDPTGAGEASSTALPQLASAYALVTNIYLDQPQAGTYRRWRIGLGNDPAGTDCTTIDPVVVFDLYTIYSSAPRGEIPLSLIAPPPQVFPTLYGELADGSFSMGTLSVTGASSTKLVGSFSGFANIAGQPSILVDLTFDAPTCAP